MVVKGFVVSPVQSNCYVLSESMDKGAKAVIVDPGDTELTAVFNYISNHEFHVVENWNTHAHFDHVMGVDIVRDRFSIQSNLHSADSDIWDELAPTAAAWTGRVVPPLRPVDRWLVDGETVRLGNNEFHVIHTPGHSPGSVCFVGEHFAFTGDTLFAGTVGRTDLPGSRADALSMSLERLKSLPGHLLLYPGHMQSTSMGHEMATNPFLLNPQLLLS